MSVHSNEHARQRALDAYRAVDSLPEVAYDDIVRLASMLCDVPIALVSLIDRDRQWFKASCGLEMRETSRDIAFCDHAIRQPGQLMEVPDARNDQRFADNPLVTGSTAFQFYAGMPLVTPSGAAIGTVCVLDQKPRALNESQRQALASLARLTMNLLPCWQPQRRLRLPRHRQRRRKLQRVVTRSPFSRCRISVVPHNDWAVVPWNVRCSSWKSHSTADS